MTTYATREEAEEAAKAESAEMLESLETVDFDGQNCEDVDMDCDGWDGNDRRCGCGNRRVGWTFTNYNDCWQYYAEAY